MRRSEEELRLERFTLVLTPPERQALELAARAERTSMSELVRRRLFSGPSPIPVPAKASDAHRAA